MKTRSTLILLIAIATLTTLKTSQVYSQERQPTWEVYFSPRGGCTEAIIKHLDSAKKTVLIQAYSFTSEPIAKALLNAHKKGIRIEVILDKNQKTAKYSSATFFLNQGIPVRIDRRHAIAHNKVMIIDGETVITGSFNFTKQAEEKNAENLLIIRDKKLSEIYIKNWENHAKHSEAYKGRGR